MFNQLKKIAQQELMKRIAGNALDNFTTEKAGQEGINSIFSTLQETLASGKGNLLNDLFAQGDNQEAGTNDLVNKLKSQFQDILQQQGLSAEDAEKDADSGVNGIIGSIQEKFASKKDEDKGFDLNDLQDLAKGDAAEIIGKVKNLFG